MEFQITSEAKKYEQVGEVGFLRFIGSIDQKSMSSIETSMGEFYTKDVKYYIFDFSETHNINSTGIGVLINISSHISMVRGAVCLINADKFKNLIETIGLSERLPIVDGETAAVEYLKNV